MGALRISFKGCCRCKPGRDDQSFCVIVHNYFGESWMKIFLNSPKQRYTRSTGVAKLSTDQTGTTRKHKTVLETEAEMEGKKPGE